MYSLPKQNIKSCNAKRRRQREWWKNNSRSNQQKRNFALASHSFCIFLCRCFARIQRVTCRHFLVTLFMEEMSYVLFTFFKCRSFTSWSLIFSSPLQNFHVVFPTKFCLLCFLSLAVALSLFFSLNFAGLSPTFSFSLSLPFFTYTPNLWTWQLT